MRAWALLAVVLVLVSGCTQSKPPVDPIEKRTKPAEDLESIATAKAREWDAGVQLLAMLGWETTAAALAESNASEDQHGYSMTLEPDPHRGDGRALTWAFDFNTTTRPNVEYIVIIAANGTVMESFETGGEDFRVPTGSPLKARSITSVRAAEIANEHNATWRELVALPETQVVMLLWSSSGGDLGEIAGNPYWNFFAIAQEAQRQIQLVIDAQDGTVVRIA